MNTAREKGARVRACSYPPPPQKTPTPTRYIRVRVRVRLHKSHVETGITTHISTPSTRRGRVQVISAKRGRGHQMNRGAEEARGDLLLFMHADCRLPPDTGALLDEEMKRYLLRHRLEPQWGAFRSIRINVSRVAPRLCVLTCSAAGAAPPAGPYPRAVAKHHANIGLPACVQAKRKRALDAYLPACVPPGSALALVAAAAGRCPAHSAAQPAVRRPGHLCAAEHVQGAGGLQRVAPSGRLGPGRPAQARRRAACGTAGGAAHVGAAVAAVGACQDNADQPGEA